MIKVDDTLIDTVTIPKHVYEELLDASSFLDALRNAGVDNWYGYDLAVEIYQQERDDDQG